MVFRFPYLLLLGCLGLAACPASPPTSQKPTPTAPLPNALPQLTAWFDGQWAMNPLWEDSLAEVAVYDAAYVVGGETYRTGYVQRTEKQEFERQHNTITDDYERPDAFPVLAVQQRYTLPTTPQPQHYQASLFFRRQNPVGLYRLTASAQEWGGNTFKSFQDDGLQYLERYSSYHAGEGSGQRHLRRDLLFEDALPYTLRSLRFPKVAQSGPFHATICEAQLAGPARKPIYYQAEIGVRAARPDSTAQPAWRVRVRLAAGRENVYWFAQAYPHVLLRQTTWDGRRLVLRQVERLAPKTALTDASPSAQNASLIANMAE